MSLHIAQYRRFDTAEREVKSACLIVTMCIFAVGFWFNLRKRKGDGPRVAVGGQSVDPRAAGITEAEQFGYLVEGLAGSVVYSVAYIAVVPVFSIAVGEVQVRVTA